MTLNELLYKVDGEIPDEIDADLVDVTLDVKIDFGGRTLDITAVSFDGDNTLVIQALPAQEGLSA